ncbi:MAG: response regulator transcription factor [Caldilineaceae bacterium]|nr:response regulator transcription factor [Caldilineaceae bacterium]
MNSPVNGRAQNDNFFMDGKKILIIDDDVNLGQTIKLTFARAGAQVFTAVDGRDGLRQFYEYRPDLVILDIRMPDINGWETCRQIRLLSNIPIIMLTTLDKDEDIIRGLDHGADDFVTKPFSRDVLLARARAVLRRTDLISTPEDHSTYHDGYLLIDIRKHQIQVNGQNIQLTSTEFRLLSYLLQNAGQVLSYQNILDKVWGWEYQDSIDYVHVYISHLRRKLEIDPRNPRYLVTERGIGYRFERRRP